ncbi:pseudouridine synthase family protein [Campylobacter canadensis]|uniref:RNA pseudouridylate synthase n=1 Tax=Campylobacter canadensis TaxID=449520 RepID=A0ABS7WRI2_9BACT|nr:RluA family pseudouridine synthase [Campylobacter canadensis]MBZ7987341.1 RluA family pseudouridine synthase [Campylobacter canadensis]MBZ7994776.1 RluA family pseudouridine synthase [Campylobacter canadensis]MBZ7996516.1 RluA family pseudouridine synthase [Campylobacter canadensis]MBZ7998488.1 RluA family pseudouridine synthase [Campylobacter canadensis]MBZ8000202.1 RluA family pseudouridine synthase [Campylobacter canadensis]
MKQEKAYKILAKQENISNNAAKELIDSGLVMYAGKRLEIARGLMPINATLKLAKIEVQKIFEDENILAINKPIGIQSDMIKNNYILLNRLDKDTSGIVLFAKNEEFYKKAIEEYKALRVKKLYLAIVSGKVIDEMIIDDNILSIKNKQAFSKLSNSKNSKEAYTKVSPLLIEGKKSLVKVQILTGRTHQIRVHLNSKNYGILGDVKYSRIPSNRLMLHCARTSILNYDFKSAMPNDFLKEFNLNGLNLDFII